MWRTRPRWRIRRYMDSTVRDFPFFIAPHSNRAMSRYTSITVLPSLEMFIRVLPELLNLAAGGKLGFGTDIDYIEILALFTDAWLLFRIFRCFFSFFSEF